MPRGRKADRKVNEKTEKNECCGGGKRNKTISIGLFLIILGLAAKSGWDIADLLMLAGAIFLVKGLLLGIFNK